MVFRHTAATGLGRFPGGVLNTPGPMSRPLTADTGPVLCVQSGQFSAS